jgi:hypothetical protein
VPERYTSYEYKGVTRVTHEAVGGLKEELRVETAEKVIEETSLSPYLQYLYFPDVPTHTAVIKMEDGLRYHSYLELFLEALYQTYP